MLIGAVSTQVNAWSPLKTLLHCLTVTQCKIIILDTERADRVEPVVEQLRSDTGAKSILVFKAAEGKGQWQSMENWDTVMQRQDISNESLKYEPIVPEDNATIFFTSGTTGSPKGVLSTHRMFLTNVLNVLVGSRRAALRRGDNILPVSPAAPPKGMLVSVPLFHVTGCTSLAMLATFGGAKLVFMRKWEPADAVSLIKKENIGMAGGVPSMVTDLTEAANLGLPLETLSFGGAVAPELLASRAGKVFPTAMLSQGYGLTETNSVAVSIAGEDYIARPLTCGLPTPVNDLLIVNDNKVLPVGGIGEVWIRGPNVMKGYWGDPAATKKALTQDGWFKTGDLGYLDKDGFLYIRDRIKDVIIRGGENIASVSVENALYVDRRVLEAAAIGIPHHRLGEQVAAVVVVKPEYHGEVTESSLIAVASKNLPRFAVPVLVIIQNEPLERTPSGKIIKVTLRDLARSVWEKRAKQTPKL